MQNAARFMAQNAARSSYLAAACRLPEDDSDTFLNRKKMNEYFRKDVAQNEHFNQISCVRNRLTPTDAGCTGVVRFASWNINVLCGLATTSWVTQNGECIAAEQAAAVIREMGADVLVLQEAMNEPDDKGDDLLKDACARVCELDTILQSDGYKVFRSQGDGHGNHVVLASKVAPSLVDSVALDLGKTRELVRIDGQNELTARVAIYAELQIGTSTVGIYGIHMYHKDCIGDPESGDRVDGLRSEEIEALMADMRGRSADMFLIGGDFNQERRQDYTVDEQVVVERTNKRFGKRDSDGVADALQAAGFRACWDDPAPRNFLQAESGESSVGPPPSTHWTGLSLDYIYSMSRGAGLRLLGAHVWYSDVSDHLPVFVDVGVGPSDPQ